MRPLQKLLNLQKDVFYILRVFGVVSIVNNYQLLTSSLIFSYNSISSPSA